TRPADLHRHLGRPANLIRAAVAEARALRGLSGTYSLWIDGKETVVNFEADFPNQRVGFLYGFPDDDDGELRWQRQIIDRENVDMPGQGDPAAGEVRVYDVVVQCSDAIDNVGDAYRDGLEEVWQILEQPEQLPIRVTLTDSNLLKVTDLELHGQRNRTEFNKHGEAVRIAIPTHPVPIEHL